MAEFLRGFRGAAFVCALGFVGAFVVGGMQAVAIVGMLGVLEIVLSFDNAVVNATVLVRMPEFWRRMFLTVGVAVAVIGVRLVFPLLVVAVSAHLSPTNAVDLALNHQTEYHTLLLRSQPKIAAFGGVFLLMIFLDFICQERPVTWLGPVERVLARIGRIPQLPTILTVSLLLVGSRTFFRAEANTVLFAGGIGLVSYLMVNGLGELFAEHTPRSARNEDASGAAGGTPDPDAAPPAAVERPKVSGMAAFLLFCYLELLDASFSFDSVLGAFSVSVDVVMITIGLAMGVAFFRSLTVYIVNRNKLDEYVYLEHGAYYAIGALAVLLLVEIWHDVPDILTALAGVAIIVAAFVSSIVHGRQQQTFTAVLDQAERAKDDVDTAAHATRS